MDTSTSSGLMEEYELMKQQKYRVYMTNIDKALKNFEYSSEWADLISALGKLNKVSAVHENPVTKNNNLII
jgi:NAD-dependent SIR2 family protein deacetylase